MMLERNQLGVGRHPALLVVDVTIAFTDPESPLGAEVGEMVNAIACLLDAFRQRELPVFFTTVSYDAPDQARAFRNKLPALEILKAGSEAVRIDPRVAPHSGESVVVKHLASGFFGTDLDQQLMAANADSVLVTGLTTSGCVRASAVDALQHGYRTVVPREAVGDRDQPAHEANLHDIDGKYGDVLALEEVLGQLPAL